MKLGQPRSQDLLGIFQNGGEAVTDRSSRKAKHRVGDFQDLEHLQVSGFYLVTFANIVTVDRQRFRSQISTDN